MSSIPTSEPITVTDAEREILSQLDTLLNEGKVPRLTVVDNQLVDVPPSIAAILQQVIHHLARGDAVTVVFTENAITTQDAADILQMSRTYFIRLLDAGEIPYIRVGTHRRLQLVDVLAYQQKIQKRQSEKIAELVRLSEEMGGYE